MENQMNATQTTQVLQLCPIGVLVTDSEKRITWANNTFEGYLGKTVKELLNKQVEDLFDREEGESAGHQTTFYLRADSNRQERWLKRISKPLTPGVADSNTVEFFIDITETRNLAEDRDRLVELVQEVGTFDPNSGLLTGRAIIQNLDLLVTRSRRYNNPLSVVVMEIEKFERGSGAALEADQVFLAVGQFLKDQLRWADLISRNEENQFLLVLPETPKEATTKLIEKIDNHLEGLTVPYAEGEKITVKVKFGMASWEKGDDGKLLLSRAQESLKTA